MSITFIIGWLFIIASWIPKPFIKNERKRTLINMILSGLALSIFVADLLHQFIK